MERVLAIVWGWPLLILFLGVGLWFTVRLRGIQFRRLGEGLRYAFSRNAQSGISPYGALCTALAATIGTGNIVGVAAALAAGGPGALLWMLIAAFLGMATQYTECFLAAKYRLADGFGGPFAYIERAIGGRTLAKLCALRRRRRAFGRGNAHAGDVHHNERRCVFSFANCTFRAVADGCDHGADRRYFERGGTPWRRKAH